MPIIIIHTNIIIIYYFSFKYYVAIISTVKPNLQTFIKYAKVELTPPKLSDLPEVKNEISKIIQTARTGRWKNITVKVCYDLMSWNVDDIVKM